MAEAEEWIDISGDGGILKKILVEGTGPMATVGEKVKVHYVGTLTDTGVKFDSSRDRDTYFEFDLGAGRVIKGWDRGVATMKVGEKCILRCREDYAYGKNGSPPSIPGGATLDFEVELFFNFADVMPGVTALTVKAPSDFHPIKDEAPVTFDFSLCDSAGENSTLAMSGVTVVLNEEDTYEEWPQWFHQCLSKMKKGEIKVFEVKRQIPPASWSVTADSFFFRVEVQEVVNPKESFERNTEENIEEATKRKERGNMYFKSGKYERALTQYQKGCDELEYEINKKENPSDLKEAFAEDMHKLYVTLYANMSMAYLKSKKYDEGIESATKALEYDEKHLKALCRRAQCLAQSGRFPEAERDCAAVLAEDANNTTAKQILKYTKGKVTQEKRRMKKMASRMFKKKPKKKAEAGEPAKEEGAKEEELDDLIVEADGGENEI